MGSDVGQIFPSASLHRDHSISNALVCEKELSHMVKTAEISIWCAIISSPYPLEAATLTNLVILQN